MFARGEWEGDGRPDELCSGSSDSSTSDATTARWHEACKTRVAASQSTRRSEWSSPSETKPRPRGSGRSGADPTHEGITAAFVPSVEAWAVTLLPKTQETPAMLKAGMLAASTSASAGEWQASAQRQVSAWLTLSQATKVPAAISKPTSTSVSPASLVFLGGRLVQMHLQAEHRKRHANECTDAEHCGLLRFRKGEERHRKTHC